MVSALDIVVIGGAWEGDEQHRTGRPRMRDLVTARGRDRRQESLRDTSPVKNTVPSKFTPIMTWCLIASNCAVFLPAQPHPFHG